MPSTGIGPKVASAVGRAISLSASPNSALPDGVTPRDVHGLLMGLFEGAFKGVPDDQLDLYARLDIDFDRSAMLIGTHGIPSKPFVINPRLFELEGFNDTGERISSITLGQAALKFIQAPLLFYRIRVINALQLEEQLIAGENFGKSSIDSLIEYSSYLHVITVIRAGISDPEKGRGREIALKSLANSLKNLPDYEAVGRLIEFALTKESDFGKRQKFAIAAASSEFYGEIALPDSDDARFDVHGFTRKLVVDVGGIFPEDRVQLLKKLEDSISAAQSIEELVAIVTELAKIEDLELSPVRSHHYSSFDDWLKGLSRRDRWEAFIALHDMEQFLIVVERAFSLRDDLGVDTVVGTLNDKDQEIFGSLVGELAQVAETLENKPISHSLFVELSSLVKFFEVVSTGNQEEVRQALRECQESRAENKVTKVDLLRSDIKDLVARLHENKGTPEDVIDLLRMTLGATRGLPPPHEDRPKLPMTISEWALYVKDMEHTHTLTFLVEHGTEEQIRERVRLHLQLMETALPLYALCDRLQQWTPWIEALSEQDALMAQATLIAFEGRPERLTHCLSEILRARESHETIWHKVFNDPSLDMIDGASELRDEFLRRIHSLELKGIINVSFSE